ncbi:MAG: glycine cleavage system aminomethyltransferase GcvT [Proteobacteria bacterium]|nr:glycine cleavage system aminomethyltransferase GcvT [Pseudomonadota bacterium]
MPQQTPLFDLHKQLGGLMVDFAGWSLPLHYGSQVSEHHQVRKNIGVFDISHMGAVDIVGAEAEAFLRYALANDVRKLNKNGKALYTCLLNVRGGIVDDLIVYRLQPDSYRLVINAARRSADLEWLNQLSGAYQVAIKQRWDLAMLAIQGPMTIEKLSSLLEKPLAAKIPELKPFHFFVHDNWQVSKTGYTGEDGIEIILPSSEIIPLWKKLIDNGVPPIGLGARDTLRLEAGLNLYGSDMDQTTTPAESNLEWTVAWLDSNRNFIGKEALAKQKQQGVPRRLVGLILSEGGVLRNHQRVYIDGELAGEITSGGYSPTLNCSIAMARIPTGSGGQFTVGVRNKMVPVQVTALPFFKRQSINKPESRNHYESISK